jgi:hypothetical protein
MSCLMRRDGKLTKSDDLNELPSQANAGVVRNLSFVRKGC